jgi:hypothetical protein
MVRKKGSAKKGKGPARPPKVRTMCLRARTCAAGAHEGHARLHSKTAALALFFAPQAPAQQDASQKPAVRPTGPPPVLADMPHVAGCHLTSSPATSQFTLAGLAAWRHP